MHGEPGGAAADQRLRLRQFTDELMFEIGNLTGQDYVDEYATKGPAKSAERTQAATDLEMLPRRSSTEVLKTTALAS